MYSWIVDLLAKPIKISQEHVKGQNCFFGAFLCTTTPAWTRQMKLTSRNAQVGIFLATINRFSFFLQELLTRKY